MQIAVKKAVAENLAEERGRRPIDDSPDSADDGAQR